jgi:hypothetical protein
MKEGKEVYTHEKNLKTNFHAYKCSKSRGKLGERRAEILSEIFLHEKNYVEDLRVLVCLFLKPLQIEQEILSKEDVAAIFLNIEVVYQVSKELFRKLELLFPFPDRIDSDAEIGCVYFSLRHFKQVHTIYCSNYTSGLEHNKRCEKSNNLYANFIKEIVSNNRECKGLYLKDFLIKPVQHISKYPMLFSELLLVTPTSHSDYDLISLSETIFENMVNTAIQESAKKVNAEKIRQMRITIDGLPEKKLLEGCRFIRDDNLSITIFGTRKPSIRHIYLLHDLLIITKKKSRLSLKLLTNTKIEKVVFIAPLKYYELVDVNSQEKFLIKLLHKLDSRYNTTLIYESAERKNDWVIDIKDCIDNCLDLGTPTKSILGTNKTEKRSSSFRKLSLGRNSSKSGLQYEDKENENSQGDQTNEKKLYRTLSVNHKPTNHGSVANRKKETFTKQLSKLFLHNLPPTTESESAQSPDLLPNDFIVRTLPLSDRPYTPQNSQIFKNPYAQPSNTDSSKKIPREEPLRTLPLSDRTPNTSRNCRNSPPKKHYSQHSLTDYKAPVSRQESIPKIISLNDQNPKTSLSYQKVRKHYTQKSCADPIIIPQDVKEVHLPKSHHIQVMDDLDYTVLSQTPKINFKKHVQSRSCHKCKIHIPDSVTYIEYGNRYYHPDCVVCSTCQKNPANQLFTIHSDEIYCEQCFNSFLVGNIVEFTEKDVEDLFVFN